MNWKRFIFEFVVVVVVTSVLEVGAAIIGRPFTQGGGIGLYALSVALWLKHGGGE